MKKLTFRMKRWLAHRRRQEARKTTSKRIASVLGAAQLPQIDRAFEARQDFQIQRSKLPATAICYSTLPKHATFQPPNTFSFNSNYEPTLAFIMDFQRIFQAGKWHRARSGKGMPYYADFGNILQIDAGAGLVLAAEIDRYASKFGKPRKVYDHLWQEPVRDFFIQAGLFDMLGIDPHQIKSLPATGVKRETLKFVRGSARNGKAAQDLLLRVEELTHRTLSARPLAYNAVAEALANVGHAYPADFVSWPYFTSEQWWASGFWEPSGNRVGLQLYDCGATIPATLPKQTHYPWILKFLDPEAKSAGLIAAAMEYGRTSTGQPGRGKGLAEMADWIERTGTGFLRILSGTGQVTYRPGGAVDRRNYNVPFRGTLVEWEVTIDE